MRIFKFLKNKLKISRALIILWGVVIFSFFALGFLRDTKSPLVFAQSAKTNSPDAIAIRVIPNLNHYSVSRWYSQQEFKGSPQALTVDGYEALRDGRTVYVNAANVTDTDLYTNIYLISYNQEAEAATQNILNQIISHWKFNTNLADLFPDLVNGQCSQTEDLVCLTDVDCPQSEYCGSQKAKITRDTKRLSRLAEIKMAVENYKNKRIDGYYPKLAAGTYLANKTVSTWPSWQQTLAKELGTGLPTDPINKLGSCPGYDSTTCWNEVSKIFADPTPGNGEFNLPAGSNAFVYTAASDGSSYNVCGVMESGYINLGAGACAGSAAFGGTSLNRDPVITCGTLIGSPNKEFKGYIGASDLDGDKLTWSLNTTGTTWTGWSAIPILKDTVNSNQKEIYATKSGDKGSYSFSVTVNDGKGGQATKTCYINIFSSVSPEDETPCLTNGVCDGVCPTNCTVAEDLDCGGAGCCGDGNCDSARGENSTSCPFDCPSIVNNCVFPLTFPCVF